MTYEGLRETWNALRSAAWGRGTTPLVDPTLAAEIAGQYNLYSRFYDRTRSVAWVGPVDVMPSELQGADEREAAHWAGKARLLASKLKTAGTTLPDEIRAHLETVPDALTRLAQGAGLGLGAALLLLVLVLVVKR